MTESGELFLLSNGSRMTMEMLDSGGCFLLDTGSDIFVWIGKMTSKEYRNVTFAKAGRRFDCYKSWRERIFLFSNFFFIFDSFQMKYLPNPRRAEVNLLQ